MKQYLVRLDVTAILEVADGTTDDEFYELYHNIAGVSVNLVSSMEDKIKVVSCEDEMTHYEKENG